MMLWKCFLTRPEFYLCRKRFFLWYSAACPHEDEAYWKGGFRDLHFKDICCFEIIIQSGQYHIESVGLAKLKVLLKNYVRLI